MSSSYFNLNEEAPSQSQPSARLHSARSNIEMVPVQQYQPVVRPQIDQPTLRRVVKWEICLKVVAWILMVRTLYMIIFSSSCVLISVANIFINIYHLPFISVGCIFISKILTSIRFRIHLNI